MFQKLNVRVERAFTQKEDQKLQEVNDPEVNMDDQSNTEENLEIEIEIEEENE